MKVRTSLKLSSNSLHDLPALDGTKASYSTISVTTVAKEATAAHPVAKFRPDIEGLRGIAVLLVVLYHSRLPGIPGGYIGVDVFFVISGYLITGLLVKEIEANGRIDFIQFYARRARRLLPAAALTILATLICALFLYAPSEQRSLAKTAAATALYSSNIRFARQSTDYLAADAAADPFLHTWSLAVEEQFYIVWPMFIMLGMWGFRAGGNRRRLYILMAVAAALSFAGSLWLMKAAQPWAFFGSPPRAWEFALGGAACFRSGRSRFDSSRALPWAGLAAILGAAALFTARTQFPGTAALVPALGSVAVLLFRAQPKNGVTWLLSHPVPQYLGRLSYSWYLWHWPVLVLAGLVWNLNVWSRLLCVVLSLALASATYALIEGPIRSHRFLLPRPRLSVVLAGCLTVMTAGGAGLAYIAAVRSEKMPSQLRFTQAANDLAKVYSNGCHVSYSDTDSPECAFGDVRSKTTVVLFGDSHAAQWFPVLERIAIEKHWKLISLTKSACPAASIDVYDMRLARTYTECSQWRTSMVRRIIHLRPAVIVISNYSGGYFKEGASPTQWAAGLRSTFTQFSQAGLRTLLVRDPPTPLFDVSTCLARAAWTGSSDSCVFQRELSTNATVSHLESDAVSKIQNTSVVDLSSIVCETEKCEPIKEGVILYRDQSHLTASYVSTLAPMLEPLLERLVTPGGQK